MAEYALDIEEFVRKAELLPVIDVRSPAEFDHAHIPGAVNMPLFTNEERSVIGTLYMQKGSSEAIMKGLDITGPKFTSFARTARQIAPGGETLLHCWRGGMRSNSVAWLLNMVGIKTYTLTGGYKNYRRYAQHCFGEPLNLVVIGGMTGSGKSEILEALEKEGEQIIHLELLARHKGSVFGGIGMPEQPTTEQFENDLFETIRKLDTSRHIFIEDESLAIGKVFIPRSLYDQMSSARFINLVVPLKRRINHLVSGYTGGSPELLTEAVRRIERRLGLKNTNDIIAHIQHNEMHSAVEKILIYYDKIYQRSMGTHPRKVRKEIVVEGEDFGQTAEKIMNYEHAFHER
jgi:tRNA 2-selenouridine synthase